MAPNKNLGILGICLQIMGTALALVGCWLGSGYARNGRRCHYIGPDVMSTVLHECTPGENRRMMLAVGLLVLGVVAFAVGKQLAKGHGLE